MLTRLLNGLSVLALCVLTSCGSDGNNGGSGSPGEDGKDTVCTTEPAADGVYVICKKPDGSVSKAKIENGKPGEPGEPGEPGTGGGSGIVKEISCSYKWEVPGEPAGRYYQVNYTVLRTAAESAIASLHTLYYVGAAGQPDSMTTIVWGKASGMQAKAPIGNYMWDVSLVSDSQMKLKKKSPSVEEKVVPCS